MKKLILMLLSLALCVCMTSAAAEDAVSSATVNVTAYPELQEHENAKTLVIYFSADDTVKAVALVVADALEADAFEVVPEQPYTAADLAYYTDGRCDREQADAAARPGIVSWPDSLDQYDVVFIGYPVWHGQAPKVLYTLLEEIDLSGKTVVPFCTSISSGAGSSADNLAKLTGDTVWIKAERIANHATEEQIRTWAVTALEGARKGQYIYKDKILVCKDCGNEFIFTAGEQEFYDEKGFQGEPTRCKSCRRARQSNRTSGTPALVYEAVCAKCGKSIQVSFEPREDLPVYCDECFAALNNR